jgi:hypothetical protein
MGMGGCRQKSQSGKRLVGGEAYTGGPLVHAGDGATAKTQELAGSEIYQGGTGKEEGKVGTVTQNWKKTRGRNNGAGEGGGNLRADGPGRRVRGSPSGRQHVVPHAPLRDGETGRERSVPIRLALGRHRRGSHPKERWTGDGWERPMADGGGGERSQLWASQQIGCDNESAVL